MDFTTKNTKGTKENGGNILDSVLKHGDIEGLHQSS
jgi:hypothetical protein